MRLKLLSPGEMNAEQKETYDEAISGKRGAPPAPMMAWLNSPEMARHATRLGGFLRFDTLFPAKLSEIAILVTARHWTSHYEWYAHKRLARAECCHLLAHDFCLFRFEASAAIFLGPMRDGPALVAHPIEPDALRLG